MNKILVVLTCLAFYSSNAQELKSKKGENYLPEAKDCALQIDAMPFLDYTGKLLSNAGATSPTVNSASFMPFTIGAKYFTEAKKAYRAKVRIGFLSKTVKNSVIKNSNTTDTVYTNDARTTNKKNITLSFGFEKRRGNTRLQGYYGFEGILKLVGENTKYSYGNAFTSTNPSVYVTDFNLVSSAGYANSLQSSRVTEVKNGFTFGIGARAFVGAEYFIFPKISLSAEFGWGLAYMNTNDGYTNTQRWVKTSTINTKTPKAGGSSFGIDTDNSGGQLLLSFHF